VVGEKGRKKDMPFVYFKGKKKPLGINATNGATIARLAGSPKTERWHGLAITLHVIVTDVQGEPRDAIRVRPKAARASNDNLGVGNENAPELTDAEKRAIEQAERTDGE
jgi:hypothetical protein